jgi:15-cis-phytoene synthase
MNGFLEVEELAENYRQCKLYTRHFAKTFFFSSHVLPKEKRLAAYAVYSFCRYADEIADRGSALTDIVQAERRLNELRNQICYVYSHSAHMNPKLVAFQDTVFRYTIPKEHFLDLLRGVEMDLSKKRFASFAELRDYCYCVASVVGLIMTRIFGTSNVVAFGYAEDLGIAMQLTNILRDIGEDAQRGRIYLPSDEMNRFTYSDSDIRSGVINLNFRRLMEFQIRRAREYYARAEQGIPLLTNDGSRFCVSMMSRTYARILEVIEKNQFDVYGRRAFVPLSQKISIAIGALAEQSLHRSVFRQSGASTLPAVAAGQH